LIFSLLKVRKKTGATIGGLIIGGTCLGGLTYWQDINLSELTSIFTALVTMVILIIIIALIFNGILVLVRKAWKG
jgi:hypothetical protein